MPGEDGSEIDDSPFVDPTARTVGDVAIGHNASLFPGSIVEADKSKVELGDDSILMNKAFVEGTEGHDTSVGEKAFISAGARLKGCDIGEGAMVGIDAVVLEGAEVGEEAIVGTNAIVPEGMEIPDRKLVLGQPAEIVRDVSDEELEKIDNIRSDLVGKRKEFKIIENRGNRFDVFDTPERPEELKEDMEVERPDTNGKEIPDLEEVREELKEKFDEDQIF